MSDPTFMIRTDPVIGEEDPFLSNTWDKANMEMETRLEIEHDSDGQHTAFGAVMGVEQGTYTGTGAELIVSLTDSDLYVKFIEIYTENAALPTMASDTMASTEAKQITNTAFTSTDIKSMSQGQFTVISSAEANAVGETYYYTAWGWFKTLAGVAGTGTYAEAELDFIQHGETVECLTQPTDLTADPPTRPGYQFLQKFNAGHANDATAMHKLKAFSGSGIVGIETLTYTGDGAGGTQDIALTHITDINKILIFSDTAEYPVIKTGSMSANDFKFLYNGAVDTNGYLLFGQREITVEDTLNTVSQVYHVIVWGTEEVDWSESYDSSGAYIKSLAVYDGNLYAGSGTNGKVFVFDGSTWSESYDSSETYITSLAVYDGNLYAGAYPGGKVFVFDGSTWSESYDSSETDITSLAVYDGNLYAGSGTNGKVLVFDGSTWSESYDSSEAWIMSLAVYDGNLYAGTATNGKVFVTI